MRNCGSRVSTLLGVFAGLLLIAAATPTAPAHRINVFAAAEGEVIAGHAYFSGGSPVIGAAVRISDAEQRLLAETTTDENGAFTYAARSRCDHIIVVDAGDGHAARWVVAADELPRSLPAREHAAGEGRSAPPDGRADRNAQSATRATGATGRTESRSAPLDDDALAAAIARAVGQQIRPLREQFARYEQQVRLRDIVGGIGYILGLAGLAFFLTGRRKP